MPTLEDYCDFLVKEVGCDAQAAMDLHLQLSERESGAKAIAANYTRPEIWNGISAAIDRAC